VKIAIDNVGIIVGFGCDGMNANIVDGGL